MSQSYYVVLGKEHSMSMIREEQMMRLKHRLRWKTTSKAVILTWNWNNVYRTQLPYIYNALTTQLQHKFNANTALLKYEYNAYTAQLQYNYSL